MRIPHNVTILLGITFLGLFFSACRKSEKRDSDTSSSMETSAPTSSCKDCHAKEYQDWRTSHHRKAMELADSNTILGDFSDVRFVHLGDTTRFFKSADTFYVESRPRFGKKNRYPVVYTFGVTPLQQYLLQFPGGRLQSLTVAWDTEKTRMVSAESKRYGSAWRCIPLHRSLQYLESYVFRLP